MKKIITALTLVLSLLVCQVTSFARSWNGWGQDGDIFIAIWKNEFKDIAEQPMCIAQDIPEKGGPMLDDEYDLLVPIDISLTFGYKTTEDDKNITVKHDKRTIIIYKNENKAEIDGKTIDLFHKQENGMIYIPYKALDKLFDVDLEWDTKNLYLLMTERETTPVSEEEKNLRKRMISMSTPVPEVLTVESGDEITVKVNDKAVMFPDAKPFLDDNGRTQVPVRAVSEMLNAKVDWQQDSATAVITKDNGDTVKIKLNSNVMTINEKSVQMDTAATLKDDRTFIPVRFVAEALGLTVNWVE